MSDGKYAAWIETYLNRCDGMPRNKCMAATAEMVTVFPELKVVAGFVFASGSRIEHFWCVDPVGNVVDPTAAQFVGITSYVPWKPGDEIRVGKCMNCGDEIYGRPATLDGKPACVCSKECEDILAASFAAERGTPL